jgi:hypothetical protein
MSRLHATFVALVLAAVATAGLFAAVKTVRLGQRVSAQRPASASRDIASRQAKLTRWSHSLRQELAKRPPALPKLPTFAPVQPPPAAAAAPAATPVTVAAPKVKYVRPRPVVKYRHAPPPTTTGSTQPAWSGDDESDDSGHSDDGAGDDGSAAGGD